VQPNGVLYGVTRYRFDEQRGLESASFAKRARFETDHWQLEEVTTTLLHPRKKRSEVVKLPTERWDAQLSPQLLNTV
ncbi:LptF/LptG family permease, partial [Stenotrophomonas maltophilia]